MAELIPYPFSRLISRMFRELDERDSIFDLPRRKFFLGEAGKDLSVVFHGKPAGSPLGPAAGPQSQMAQNLVLAWLCGCRVMELKTVQILDELRIPRPCIDMRNVGYNVEWSQELKLEQSLEEYVKGSMLIEILQASGRLQVEPSFAPVIWDMSVGYDLKGIQTERVLNFIRGMMDAGTIVEKLRREIPDHLAQYRDLDFTTRLSNTLTLSTFHGCPPDEIEKIIDFLLTRVGLNCVVKLNPMLLGPAEVRRLMADVMGFTEIHTPQTAFDRDTQWDQAVGFVERLDARAKTLGLSFGVKFSNTLIVQNHLDFFPSSEKEMYLSGPPLHVLAMHLVRKFRGVFADRIPTSFSAGIDRHNFADAAALGLVPITVCSDLLKPGGYGRAQSYFKDLTARMDAVGATDLPTYALRAHGHAGLALERAGFPKEPSPGTPEYARWVSAALLCNTETYVAGLERDPHYSKKKNSTPPKKIGSRLELFDCITCDKCVPVCPNDANFTYALPKLSIPIVKVFRADDQWSHRQDGTLEIAMKHQIGNFADFCNECGNCDIFCPEDGGPYVLKPRFFGSLAAWRRLPSHDGFFLERDGETQRVAGRFNGAEYHVSVMGEHAEYHGRGFHVRFAQHNPLATLEGEASGEVDLTYFHIMNALRRALLAGADITYVNA